MNCPTNLLEAIWFPVSAWIGEGWQHVTHPSVATVVCLGIVLQVSVRTALRASRAAKTRP